MVKSNGKRDTGAFEASVIAVLMADKRLWKDLVVARLRATKWVCVCDWMVKSETHRDAEILVRNPSPRLFGKKFRDSKK